MLELAAGPADTGLLAAELVAPGGKAIITDSAEAMVEAAQARAEELGATNVEIRPMEAEWIDLPTASVDAVLCRWGYMLLADPEAALRETRRVLRPGGRVALAAWARAGAQPVDRDDGPRDGRARALEPPPPDEPGPFAFGRPGRIEELLDAAGFDDIEVEPLDFAFHAPSLDAWWEHSIAHVGPLLAASSAALSPAEHYALRDAVDAAYAPYVRDDGSLELPGARAGGRRGRVSGRRDRGLLEQRCDGSPARIFDFYWGQGIADDVPALTYYLLLSLAPLALGLAAVQALLLEERAVGDRGRRPAQPLPARRHPRRHQAARARDAQQLAAAARGRGRDDAVDDLGRDRRHRALRVADARRAAPLDRHRAPAQRRCSARASR